MFLNAPEAERRLRIGYVSADLKEHSAPKAFGSMLTRYDRANFEVYVYSNFKFKGDRFTAIFKENVDHWRNILGLPDDAVAQLIREDQIDILVDLSGHSAGNRLLVFARKPAPIQISAWGYASGTGMQAMDVFFADRRVLPPQETPYFTEQVVYLPCIIGSFFIDSFPEVNQLPALAEGTLTFGCFNRLAKGSDISYRIWAEILLAVPQSRLLLKTSELNDAATRARLLLHFTRAGVAAERIILLGGTSWLLHMQAYHQVDIALDTFPQSGGVTTLEALMMGVPVLAGYGSNIAGRTTASIMSVLGLQDWVAPTLKEYVALAVQKAGNLQVLAQLRQQLRASFSASVIGNPVAYVQAVEQQYRLLWQNWCAVNQPDAEQLFQQAVVLHRAGDLQEAEKIYQAVLLALPGHPEANYNLGILTLHSPEPLQALPYFMNALEADPACRQYWLGYIEALNQTGQIAEARQMLAFARQQGLDGAEVEALDSLLSPTRDKPEPFEIEGLVALFAAGRLAEAENQAQALTVRFPAHEFGWKALGAVYKQLGRDAEALLPMQNAAGLSPGDVEAQYNLGATLQGLGRLEEAEASYRKALRINPDYADAYCNLGVLCQDSGRLTEAEASFRNALRIVPDNPQTHSNLGVTLHELGRLNEAEASFKQALRYNPNNAQAHNNLGNTQKELGLLLEAEASYRQALLLDEDYADAHYNLGKLLKALGRGVAAEECYRKILRLNTQSAEAHYNLANTLKELGKPAEALDSYHQALQIKPDFAEACCNLGVTLKSLGRLSEAEASLRQALMLKPDYAIAHNFLGVTLQEQDRATEAEASYARALQLKPDYAEACNNLGATLCGLGRLTEAEACYRRSLLLKDDYADTHYNLGIALHELGRHSEAEASYRRALQLKPAYAQAYYNLGAVLNELHRLSEAEACYRQALQIAPDYADALCNLGNILKNQDQLEEALVCYRKALQLKPDFPVAHSNLIFILDLQVSSDATPLLEERKRWDALHAAPLLQNLPYENLRQPERRLRIGYVSADFRGHSAAKIFGCMLTHFDRANYDVYAYANLKGRGDGYTELFKQKVTVWRNIFKLSDEALAKQIREDRIDILVDLSGHSAGNRLLAFARKPAPIQITAWGYAAGTGMRAMDVFFADQVVVPPQDKKYFIEKIRYLPCIVAFFFSEQFPEVNALPALSDGIVTFGSLNRLVKISTITYQAWAEILLAVPQSRLLIKALELDDPLIRERVVAHFTQAGVAAERIIMQGKTSWQVQMQTFNQIDIALDTFPHGGGVTTLEGLMMGVPAITMLPPAIIGRASASIMTTLGLQDWVSESPQAYVALAVQKAAMLASLVELRLQLRDRLSSSVIGDRTAYAQAAEREYRQLWREWCVK